MSRTLVFAVGTNVDQYEPLEILMTPLCLQLDVKEAKKVESHPQWDISDDEDKEENDGTESEGDSDYDDSEDD